MKNFWLVERQESDGSRRFENWEADDLAGLCGKLDRLQASVVFAARISVDG